LHNNQGQGIAFFIGKGKWTKIFSLEEDDENRNNPAPANVSE